MANISMVYLNSLFRKKIIRQYTAVILTFGLLIVLPGLLGRCHAEGTKQLEPIAPNSYCRVTLAMDNLSDRVPFALIDCDEEYRLNIRINNFVAEKIYFGFGIVTGYDGEVLNDVDFQIKDPAGNIVEAFDRMQVPNIPGTFGYIERFCFILMWDFVS